MLSSTAKSIRSTVWEFELVRIDDGSRVVQVVAVGARSRRLPEAPHAAGNELK